MKKLAVIIAVCMVAAATLCGCGGSNSNSSSSDNTSKTSSASSQDKDSSSSDTSEKETETETEAEAEDVTEEEASEAAAAYTGVTWKLTNIIDAEGNTQTIDEYCVANGLKEGSLETTYEFAEDGTAVGTLNGVKMEFTYTADGNQITSSVTTKDPSTGEDVTTTSVFTYDADNDILTITDENTGLTSVFEKA